ncbi:hypothetical protein GH733_010577, partial [Mirounga leonina]
MYYPPNLVHIKPRSSPYFYFIVGKGGEKLSAFNREKGQAFHKDGTKCEKGSFGPPEAEAKAKTLKTSKDEHAPGKTSLTTMPLSSSFSPLSHSEEDRRQHTLLSTHCGCQHQQALIPA